MPKYFDIHIWVFLFLVLVVCASIYRFKRLRKQLKTIVRFFLYENPIVKILRNQFLQLMLPFLAGSYYLCLDIWSDKWPLIKNHPEIHEKIFFTLITLSLIVLLIRGFADWYEQRSDKKYILFMERFSTLTTTLVTHKLNRLKEIAPYLTPLSTRTRKVLQSKDQINLILREIQALLLHNFDIKNEDAGITIMHQAPNSETWYYKYDTDKTKRHTKATLLMKNHSTALECINRGEPIFHPCKHDAADEGTYYLSERDQRNGEGSAFCYPVFTTTPTHIETYIVSIVTYGKRLCDPLDKAQSDAIKIVLNDICRRIDLELTLRSIWDWQANNKSK